MRFRIGNSTNRRATNLVHHNGAIDGGVHSVFPTAIVNVQPDYFEILGVIAYTDTELKKMGSEIANRDSYLRSICKTYYYTRSNGARGKSVQLFKRC